jgi:hypothetical protein
MKFSLGEIPDMHLKRLGLDRELMGRLPERTLKALLSGVRTSLMRFSLSGNAGDSSSARVLDAKLSLSRKPDGGVTMKVHPAAPGNSDSVQLDPAERDRLSNGEVTVVGKAIQDRDGRERKALVGIDPATGAAVAVDGEKLKAPHSIGGVRLDEEQRKAWKRGEEVKVGGKSYRFDPTKEDGISESTRLRFSHSRVQGTDIAIDAALLASGLGHVILLEHLADMLIHTRLQKDRNRLSDPAFRDALAKAAMELTRREQRNAFDKGRSSGEKSDPESALKHAAEQMSGQSHSMRR